MASKKSHDILNPFDQEEPQKPSQKKEKSLSKKRKYIDNIIHDEEINYDNSSSEEIEAAIKTMKFREKRGTRMKDLMTGKFRLDNFW